MKLASGERCTKSDPKRTLSWTHIKLLLTDSCEAGKEKFWKMLLAALVHNFHGFRLHFWKMISEVHNHLYASPCVCVAHLNSLKESIPAICLYVNAAFWLPQLAQLFNGEHVFCNKIVHYIIERNNKKRNILEMT